jgi:hypothetical protein
MHPELAPNGGVGLSFRYLPPDVSHVFLCQNRLSGALTLRGIFLAESFAVGDVLVPRSPREIAEAVVLWVAVQMTTFLTAHWCSNEGRKNKAVDELLTASPQMHG